MDHGSSIMKTFDVNYTKSSSVRIEILSSDHDLSNYWRVLMIMKV